MAWQGKARLGMDRGAADTHNSFKMENSESDEAPKSFFGGMPTRHVVDALLHQISLLKEGDVITHQEIEKIAGVRRSNRYKTVMLRWKRRAFVEQNILLVAERTIGYRLAPPDQRISVSVGYVSQGKRRIVKAATVAMATDHARLDEEQRRVREHVSTLPNRLRLAELTSPKALTFNPEK
jgi:alkylated DNA nucleotide flippase Atl1